MASRGAANVIAIKGSLGVQSFDDPREQRATAREALKLTPAERGDLEELWGAWQAALGMRSVHGAIEDRLRRSPPRDEVRRQVVDELERAGGRAPEGKVLRVAVAEGASRYEVKRAIQMLVMWEHVERIEVAIPAGHESKKKTSDGAEEKFHGLTDAQAEWTGFELRLTKKARSDVAERFARHRDMSPEQAQRARWQAQDDAIEAECHTIHCADAGGFSPFSAEPEIAPWRSAKVTRATLALANLTTESRKVLHAIFAEKRPGEHDEEQTVARVMGVGRVDAANLIAEAYETFKAARRKVVAWLQR